MNASVDTYKKIKRCIMRSFFLSLISLSILGYSFSAFASVTPVVSGGYRHSVAVNSNGYVLSWGRNVEGQLGDEGRSGTNSVTPVVVSGVEGTGYLANIKSVSSGRDFSVALSSDGYVYAWGTNTYGQVGNGTYVSSNVPVRVLDSSGTGYLSNIIAISAGGYHTLALTSSGEVFAWGYNGTGQLGNNTTTTKNLPVKVLSETGVAGTSLTGVTKVSAGHTHSAVCKDSVIYTWGDNTYGQLGDNTVTQRNYPIIMLDDTGVPMSWRQNFTDVEAGGCNTIVCKSYYVLVTGYNSTGALGDNTGVNSRLLKWTVNAVGQPTPILGSGGSPDYYIQSISAGRDFSAALAGRGSIYTWGANQYYQLGDGTKNIRFRPVVPNPDGSYPNPVLQIDCGYDHILKLKTDGTVYAWGSNSEGQIGDNSYIDRSSQFNQVVGIGGNGTLNLYADAIPPESFTPTATADSSTQITLSGTTTDAGGLAAAPYNFSKDNGSTYVGYQAGSSYAFTGLNPNASYTFKMKAKDAAGNEVETAGVTRYTLANVPTSLTGAVGNPVTQVNLSWNANSNPGTTVYELEVSNNGSDGWTNIYTGTSTSYTQTEVPYNTTRYYRVRAKNGDNVYISYTDTSSVVIPATVPGVPTEVSAVAGNTKATVSFTAPVSSGGSAITNYTVTSSPGGITATGSSSPITITGLTNGTAYTFTVKATNAVGTGADSAASSAVTPQLLWEVVGTPGISGGDSYDQSLDVYNGTPYISFTDSNYSGKMTVMKYNGASWVSVGSRGFTPDGTYYSSNKVYNGTPYIAYADKANSNKASMMKYDGVSWVNVGSAGFSAGSAYYLSFDIDNNGTPYVAYSDGANSSKVTVMKYNGASWVNVGNMGFSPGGISSTSSIAVYNGTPYVAFTDAANGDKATVMKYDGASWVSVGNADFSVGAAPFIKLEFYNGTPYVVFQDGNSSKRATVMKYNGTSWVNVGNAGFTAGEAGDIGFYILSNGEPYVSYIDAANGWRATVMKYDGANWVNVGNTGFSQGSLWYTSISISNGVAYVGYRDGANSCAPTVMKCILPATVPEVPTGVSAVEGNAQATVSFTAPASNGGSAITGYTVTSSPGGVTATGSASPIIITGLTNGTAYTFTVKATNAVGTGVDSVASSAVTPATMPEAPTGVRAVGGDAQALVSFTVPASNGGSEITGYTVTSNPGGITATGSGSPITITGLTNGTAYTFTVKATNALGDGPASAPSADVHPPNLIGNSGFESQLELAWALEKHYGIEATVILDNQVKFSGENSARVDANVIGTEIYMLQLKQIGLPLEKNQPYTVKFKAKGDFQKEIVLSCMKDSAPYSDFGLFRTINIGTEWNEYVYSFTTNDLAENDTRLTFELGNHTGSIWFDDVEFYKGLTTVPGAPTVVSAVAGNAQATVSFTVPASDGGTAITGYTVTSSPSGITSTGSASPITITGLTNGTSYTFTVKATNAIGTGGDSAASSAVNPATVPGAPTGVSATAGNAQATVSFTVPVSDGGSAITGYTVTSSLGGITATGSASPIMVTGLTNGTSYTFTVKATNAIGTGADSVSSNAVIPFSATVPGVPTGVSAVAGNAQATVSFTAPASDGGSAITSYTVTSSPGGLTATGSGSPITITGLTNGMAYTFTVEATNAVGTGADSAASNAVTPATVPGAPTGISAVAGNAQATVSFTAPVSNGGGEITSYTVTSSPDGITAIGSASPIIITGLTNGTSYTFTVKATNAVGTGVDSAASSEVTPATVPGAPTGVSAVAGNIQATVSFTAPASNGGSAITGYTVTSSPGGLTATGSGSPITITGLTNGTAYTFTVKATNAVGTGADSAASTAVTPATVPGAPTGVSAVAGNTQATVSFTVPASNGGSAITGYTVTSSPGGITATGSGSPITITGLTNGTAYTFTVKATNAVGIGVDSAASNAVTPATVPGAPTGISAVAGNAQVVVSFTAPASNGGSAITVYTVTSSTGGITATGGGSPITITGLTNGTSYTFTVKAANAVGEGAASVSSNAVTPFTKPGAPSGVTAVMGNGQARISFVAPVSNGGSVITSYTVTANPGNITATGSSSPIVITGLTNGITYTFTVKATNAAGASISSAPSNKVTPATDQRMQKMRQRNTNVSFVVQVLPWAALLKQFYV